MLGSSSARLAIPDTTGFLDTAYACFTIGTMRYAMDTRYVHRVIEWIPTPPPENVPMYVVGITTRNETRIPIMDLMAPFESRALEHPLTVLILRYAEDMIGVIIDQLEVKILPNTVRLKRIAHENNPSGMPMIAAVLTRGEDQFVLLDAPQIFEQTRAGMVAHMLNHCPPEAGVQTT